MIIALPVVGMICYLLLGETNIGRRRMRRIRQVLAGMPDVAGAPVSTRQPYRRKSQSVTRICSASATP